MSREEKNEENVEGEEMEAVVKEKNNNTNSRVKRQYQHVIGIFFNVEVTQIDRL